MSTDELIYKIKMKLKECQRVYGSKSKQILEEPNPNSENRYSNPFGSLGKKRSRASGEDSENCKFVFKHKEGYINAVKRNVPFEFFL